MKKWITLIQCEEGIMMRHMILKYFAHKRTCRYRASEKHLAELLVIPTGELKFKLLGQSLTLWGENWTYCRLTGNEASEPTDIFKRLWSWSWVKGVILPFPHEWRRKSFHQHNSKLQSWSKSWYQAHSLNIKQLKKKKHYF